MFLQVEISIHTIFSSQGPQPSLVLIAFFFFPNIMQILDAKYLSSWFILLWCSFYSGYGSVPWDEDAFSLLSMVWFIGMKLLLGSVWLEEWKSGRMEKWEDRKDVVFPHVCLVGGVEKWENGKLFCLVGEKNGRMENVVYINWLLCPYYIIYKK